MNTAGAFFFIFFEPTPSFPGCFSCSPTASTLLMTVTKVRIRFSKHGDLRLLSHHDLMRGFERALRRAGLPMVLSQGFSPRPKMSIVQALALGIEGRRELLDLELSEPLEAEEVRSRLAAVLPPGLDLLEVERVPAGKTAQPVAFSYQIEIPEARRAATSVALGALLSSSSRPYVRHREGKTIALDLRPFLLEGTLDLTGTLRFRLRVMPTGSARPEEILDALELRDLLTSGGILIRDDIELAVSHASGGAVPEPTPGSTHSDFRSVLEEQPLFTVDAEVKCPPSPDAPPLGPHTPADPDLLPRQL